MFWSTLAVVLVSCSFVGASGAAQRPLQVSPTVETAGGLDDSSEGFKRLEHPLYPNHSVRFKESRFCDESVRAYTGYIDVEAKHLFFYFFESRRDPDADDVVFWLNGGPGGSSAFGLFMELGPCRPTSPEATKPFEHSWNEFANLLFVDQPVGTGFSYADHGEYVSSTSEAAKDITAFLAIFFHYFSNFQGRKFHMAGESYAGRMMPVFAASVYDQNVKLVEAGLTPINLNSIMLGNGCTNFMLMTLSYYDIQCESRREFDLPPIQTITECVKMKQRVPRCESRLQKSCIDTFDQVDCLAAMSFCTDSFSAFFVNDGGYNPHDRTRPCKPYLKMEECYPIAQNVTAFLNQPATRETLGIDPAHSTFITHNASVQARFERNADRVAFRAEDSIGALLERGVRVLLYVGVNDFVCNWMGTEKMSMGVEWSKHNAYRNEPMREWKAAGEVAGKTRSGGGMTFVGVLDAGHLTPYDQPVRVFEVARRWLAGEEM